MRKIIYSIEGNIGSGKSTLLKLIQQNDPSIEIIKEPVDEWQKIGKHNLLDKYYEDPNRWSYTFQINAILTRMGQLQRMIQNTDQRILLSERSVMADQKIFAKLMKNRHQMNDMEYELYLKMYNELDSLFEVPRIHKYIYLKTTPVKCLQRIKKRGRFEERNIELSYLEQIHELHENWMTSTNSLEIDGQAEFETQIERLQDILDTISGEMRFSAMSLA